MGSGRRAHLGAAVLLGAYWAAAILGSQFSISLPGVLYDLWYSGAPVVSGIVLAFGVGFYVAREWVLLAAFTPILTLGALELAGHRSPWHDAGPALTQYLWYPLFWWMFWFFVLPLALGVAIRRGLGARRPEGLLRTR